MELIIPAVAISDYLVAICVIASCVGCPSLCGSFAQVKLKMYAVCRILAKLYKIKLYGVSMGSSLRQTVCKFEIGNIMD